MAWDDPTVNWGRFDTVLLRSPWDYTERLPEFLAWAERVDRATLLLNPLNVVRWNTDKHYLADLAAVGIPTVPTTFVEPDAEPMEALSRFLEAFADVDEFVVKPTVSAGSRDTQRYRRDQQFAAGKAMMGAGEGMAKGGGGGGGDAGVLGGASIGVGFGLAQMLTRDSRGGETLAPATPGVVCPACKASVAPGRFCSACGKDTMVPFVPSQDKPVYCSDCFQSRRPQQPSYNRW